MSTIAIENVGAIRSLSIPVPEDGGIVVLCGRNGSGKSTALRAIDALAGGGNNGLTPRDRTDRGTIKGLGAQLTVAKSTRRSGELEVESLSGCEVLAEIVDPGVADKVAADKRRIKAFAKLVGLSPTDEAFRDRLEITAEQFDEYFGERNGADVVEWAASAKRRIQEAARMAERTANEAQITAESEETAAASLRTPLTEVVTAAEAKARHEAAIAADGAANARVTAIQESRRQLEELADARQVPEIEAELAAAAQDREGFAAHRADIAEEIARLQDQIEELKSRDDVYASQQDDLHRDRIVPLTAELERAQTRDRLIAQAGDVPDTDATSAAVEAARQLVLAIDANARADKHRLQALDKKAEADREMEKAQALRRLCDEIDPVLSSFAAEAGAGFKLIDGRIFVDHARGETAFCELSEGERWATVLGIAAKAVGRGTVLTVPQESFESLDPVNRDLLAQVAKEHGIVVVTAECSDSDSIQAIVA